MTEDQDNTLQDVHPDQLRSLRTAADLVLEKILRLQRSSGVSGNLQECWELTSFIFQTGCLTLARSKLRICPWNAAGLFRAATHI